MDLIRLTRIVFVQLIVWLFASASAFVCQDVLASQNNTVKFLTLSDIHFNPFLRCDNTIPCPLIIKLKAAPVAKWPAILKVDDNHSPAYLEDTNTVLLNQAMSKARVVSHDASVDFVVVLGDFLGHHYRKLYKQYSADTTRGGYELFAKKTMQFLAQQLEATFNGVSVLPLLGNNDSFHGDYVVDTSGGFYKTMNGIWQPLLHGAGSFDADFNRGGYYAIDMPGNHETKLLFLNSNIFSDKAKGKGVDVLAERQFTWLKQQLQSVQDHHQHAIIFMHIPEGVDIRITKSIALMRLATLWKPAYIKRYQAIVSDYGGVISGVVSSHVHMAWSGVLSTHRGEEVSLYGVSSISPNLGNIPEFSLFSYQLDDGQLIDSSTYQIPLH